MKTSHKLPKECREEIRTWLSEIHGQYRIQQQDENPTTMQEMMHVMTKDRIQILEEILGNKDHQENFPANCPICGGAWKKDQPHTCRVSDIEELEAKGSD